MINDISTADRRVEEALVLLREVGFPLSQRTPAMQRRLARIFLSICNLKPDTPWQEAVVWTENGSWAPRTRDIIAFINEHYGEKISMGSYDDIRRKNTEFLSAAGLIVRSKPGSATNDGGRGYAVNPSATKLVREFGDSTWPDTVKQFVEAHGRLESDLERLRPKDLVAVKLPSGVEIDLEQGEHNELQKAIVDDFLPRFVGEGAEVLYIGDATDKELFKQTEKLTELRFFELGHERLPDVIAYDPNKNWLFLIEAVHTSNPMSPLRHKMLEQAAQDCNAGIVYVSVFKNRDSFAKWCRDISWETEVWIADSPHHMIHFNGDKFLGPHSR